MPCEKRKLYIFEEKNKELKICSIMTRFHVAMLERSELTVFGPAPIIIASPEGDIFVSKVDFRKKKIAN